MIVNVGNDCCIDDICVNFLGDIVFYFVVFVEVGVLKIKEFVFL